MIKKANVLYPYLNGNLNESMLREHLAKAHLRCMQQLHPLPRNVQVILGGFDEEKDAYKECAKIKRELNSIGFTCSYGLDGVIYNVRPNILTT